MTRPSIRKQLIARSLIAVVVVGASALWMVHSSAKKEVDVIYDASLAQEATVLGVLLGHEAKEEEERAGEIARLLAELGPNAPERSPTLARMIETGRHTAAQTDYLPLLPHSYLASLGYASKRYFFVQYPGGQIMVRSPGAQLFKTASSGFSNIERNGVTWRVYTLIMPGTHLRVQVSEDAALRKITVTDMMNRALSPLIFMLFILALIIWVGIGSGLSQLRRVANILKQRGPHSLELISTRNVEQEVLPMVVSLNHLFARLESSLSNERHFTSDVAHELRNPLAALKMQVQAFELTADDPESQRFMRQFASGLDRISHLLNQLLVLARADTRQRKVLHEQINLLAFSESVVASHAHLAVEKNIDVSLDGEEASVVGDHEALEILLGNLVDNAIRYTPEGGSVRVKVFRDRSNVVLQVEDNGPGIPLEQRGEIFQRFRRGAQGDIPGSGLGLSIVSRIAELHGAHIILDDPVSGAGLVVRVIFFYRPG